MRLLALFLLLAGSARAISVTESLDFDQDCYGIDIATAPVTALFDSTTTTSAGATLITSTGAWKFVWVQNVDSSAAIFLRPGTKLASPSISTGTVTGTVDRGARIPAGADGTFSVVPGRVWYAKSNAAAKTAATVCRGK